MQTNNCVGFVITIQLLQFSLIAQLGIGAMSWRERRICQSSPMTDGEISLNRKTVSRLDAVVKKVMS